MPLSATVLSNAGLVSNGTPEQPWGGESRERCHDNVIDANQLLTPATFWHRSSTAFQKNYLDLGVRQLERNSGLSELETECIQATGQL